MKYKFHELFSIEHGKIMAKVNVHLNDREYNIGNHLSTEDSAFVVQKKNHYFLTKIENYRLVVLGTHSMS